MDDEYLDDVLPGTENKKHREILSQLRDIENSESEFMSQSSSNTGNTTFSSNSFLPSSMLKEPKKKKNKNHEYDPDEWFAEMMESRNSKLSKRKGSSHDFYDIFNGEGIIGKKKKKKKNKDGKDDAIDFKKEFEPEMALYRNLLIDQNKFTENLQREYDSITTVKSANRGVTKQMSDLIENITEARSLSMQLVEKNVNAKKLIAELSMKQKKELGGGLDGENMSDFATNYLKQMINERQMLLNGGTGDNSVSEYNEDEMFDLISDSLNSGEDTLNRSEETDLYLKYENRNVEIFVVITDDDVENYEFLARDENGEVIDDYPMPNRTNISVNRSTNIATDAYGKKYQIIWH